ncbi:MAG: hypothetical protein ACO1OF_16290 [Adhaeribacter sp.]
MAQVKQIKIADAPRKQPRFNLKKRYKKLNNDQKQLLIKEYASAFNKTERTLYNAIQRDNLTDEELHFFASIFECPISALYTEPLKYVPSIYELERKAHGPNLGIQGAINI